jgi:glutamate synthase (NADPH/NADH) large chain
LVDIVALEKEDVTWLKTVISRHVALTNSARAQEILTDWKASFAKIRKVLPRDYARVIAEQRKKAKVGVHG